MGKIGDYYEYTDIEKFMGDYNVNKLPDECPFCHNGIQPKIALVYEYGKKDITSAYYSLEVVFICTKLNCKEMFIAYYQKPDVMYDRNAVYTLRGVAPFSHIPVEFEEVINNLSISFVNIYNQSQKAEKYKLDQICGPGYRKALEFLVKDYAIYKNPDERENIEDPKNLLGNCINKYIDDKRIRDIAKRAAWIGNDETHYTRKWEDKDIEDLKVLIKLTVNWIVSELLSEEYIKDMK